MKRKVYLTVTILALWGAVGVNFASAQFGTLGAQQRMFPSTNPSTTFGQGNMVNNFNTYGILRAPFDPSRANDPLFNAQRLNPDGSLQGQLGNQGTVNALGGLQTGHSVTFFDYSQYFPTTPFGGSSGSLGSQSQGYGQVPGQGQSTIGTQIRDTNSPNISIIRRP